MSTFEEHQAEQDMITAWYEAQDAERTWPIRQAMIAEARRSADEVSELLSRRGRRVPAGMVEDLRNHVRKLAKALEDRG
jgi:hypothetical protein